MDTLGGVVPINGVHRILSVAAIEMLRLHNHNYLKIFYRFLLGIVYYELPNYSYPIVSNLFYPYQVGMSAFLFVSAVWFKMVTLGISIIASTLLLVGVSG